MTNNMQTRISTTGLVLAFALAASSAPATAAGDDQAKVPAMALDGTWEVMVRLINCQTGAQIGSMFPSLLAFAGNGTLVETTTNPAFAVGQRESGLGVWSRTGPAEYQAKSMAFIAFTTNPSATSPGFEAGTQTITQTIEFTAGPDQWTANATIQFADTSGAVYRQGCANAFGQRFQ